MLLAPPATSIAGSVSCEPEPLGSFLCEAETINNQYSYDWFWSNKPLAPPLQPNKPFAKRLKCKFDARGWQWVNVQIRIPGGPFFTERGGMSCTVA